jgi:hypothetical protein
MNVYIVQQVISTQSNTTVVRQLSTLESLLVLMKTVELANLIVACFNKPIDILMCAVYMLVY